jgi:hypothetical protein
MKRIVFFVFFSSFFLSCSQKQNKVENVERAFYYWKSNTSFGDESIEKINKLQVKKVYLKLFEVDYNETMGNFPYEKNKPSEYDLRKLDSLTIVPTIFIKNEIFQYNTEKSLDRLADNMVFLIDKYHKDYSDKSIFDYSEIQIDCDWTKSTKEKYFYLLKKIKVLSKKKSVVHLDCIPINILKLWEFRQWTKQC